MITSVYFMNSLQNLRAQFCGQMLLWIVEHCCADAIPAAGAVENVYIDASFTSTPERLVIGKLVECYRMIA